MYLDVSSEFFWNASADLKNKRLYVRKLLIDNLHTLTDEQSRALRNIIATLNVAEQMLKDAYDVFPDSDNSPED